MAGLFTNDAIERVTLTYHACRQSAKIK